MLSTAAEPLNGVVAHSLAAYLEAMVEKEASDLHLVPGKLPQIRVGGSLVEIDAADPFTQAAAEQLILDLRGAAGLRELKEQKDIDFAYEKHGAGRFRVNVSIQRGVPALTMRRIHSSVPNMESLGLPPVCRILATKPRGLILVTGPVNSGKSTTMAAMIEYISSSLPKRIVTLEDPVEYVYSPGKSLITQRELGADVLSFATGLRSALRQDPDVILVGELRDFDSISLAIEACETGHLVFGTLHTRGAHQTVHRIVDAFPTEAQAQIRHTLAETLKCVLSQELVKAADGRGRRAVMEILVVTSAVAQMIREGKTFQIPGAISTGRRVGMQLMDQALLALVRSGDIDPDEAYLKALDKKEFSKFVTNPELLAIMEPNPGGSAAA